MKTNQPSKKKGNKVSFEFLFAFPYIQPCFWSLGHLGGLIGNCKGYLSPFLISRSKVVLYFQ